MSSFYTLIITILFCKFFGRIVNCFLGTKPQRALLRLKTKILFESFVAPITISSALFIALDMHDRTLNMMIGCLLVLSTIVKITSNKRNYFVKLTIDHPSIAIESLTQFLKPSSKIFDYIDTTEIEIAKANWLVDYPASVNVRQNNQWVTFEIIDKQLKTELELHLSEVRK